MCLYIHNTEGYIAKKNLRVLKYLDKCNWGEYVTPFQHTTVDFNTELKPNPSSPNITLYRKATEFNKPLYSLSGGAIHASLTTERLLGDYIFDAIIPKGTKYWISYNFKEIAAEKLFITSKKVFRLTDTSIFEEILNNAPSKNDIRIGDYQTIKNTFVHPTKNINHNIVRGIVCGFYRDNTPIVCALEKFVTQNIRNYEYNYSALPTMEAVNQLNGTSITSQYYNSNLIRNKNNSFEVCNDYRYKENEHWHMGSLGEVLNFVNNIKYLNAARYITGLGFDITGEFWSCTKAYNEYSYSVDLFNHKVWVQTTHQDNYLNVVPFYTNNND